MEKRNTILLTVIAIATLLVSVVGATFAYFVASTNTTNEGNKVEATTNEFKGATIEFTALGNNLDMLQYPGGIAVYGTKAEIKKQDDGDDNDYEATFGLKIDYTNGTNSDLPWELYMVEDEYAELDATGTTICQLQQKSSGTTTLFWYSDKDKVGSTEADTGCTASAIVSKLTGAKDGGAGLGGQLIASGKIPKAETTVEGVAGTAKTGSITSKSTTPEYDQQVDLSQRKINTTSGHSTKYYYLIVKYPNVNDNQSDTDAKKAINVTLTIDGNPDVRGM